MGDLLCSIADDDAWRLRLYLLVLESLRFGWWYYRNDRCSLWLRCNCLADSWCPVGGWVVDLNLIINNTNFPVKANTTRLKKGRNYLLLIFTKVSKAFLAERPRRVFYHFKNAASTDHKTYCFSRFIMLWQNIFHWTDELHYFKVKESTII